MRQGHLGLDQPKQGLYDKFTMLAVTLTATPYQPGTIMKAAKPVIVLLQDLAEPVAYGMILWGLIKVTMGRQQEGYKTIKTAVWGFILVQLLPWFFDIIRGIGQSLVR